MLEVNTKHWKLIEYMPRTVDEEKAWVVEFLKECPERLRERKFAYTVLQMLRDAALKGCSGYRVHHAMIHGESSLRIEISTKDIAPDA